MTNPARGRRQSPEERLLNEHLVVERAIGRAFALKDGDEGR